MTKKIESLTQAQKDKFPAYIDKWTRIGLETTPANREKAEAGIVEAYRTAGLEPPRIVWCDSPLAMGLTKTIVEKIIKDKKVGDSVGASVGASVWASVGASVRASVWASVRASVGDSVWASVWDSVGASVNYSSCVYGQHEANWIGFYDYFRNELGLEQQTEKLAGLQQITENAGWFIPHKGICWISERHCVVMQDDNRRLHCENGPAVKYPDGWSIYAWHGVRIPSEWIENKAVLTPKIALTWENIEQRRAAIAILGWAKILKDKSLKPKTIDKNPDPQIGTLIEVTLPDLGKQRFLNVMCGTGRSFSLCVTRFGYNTARECNAATYGLKPEDFDVEVRT